MAVLLVLATAAQGQQVKILQSGTNTSIRGLSVVSDRVAWVSGSNGMVGRTADSGRTWKWVRVHDFEKRDFRDIEAFDDNIAVIIAVDTPACILRTIDGGDTWKAVYRDDRPGMFLDALEFWNAQSGIVIGDPLEGRFFIARTFDGGNTWHTLPEKNYPVADPGEACFAASGTNIRAFSRDAACFVTGGLRSRLFLKDQVLDLPITQGTASSGANSIAVKNTHVLVVAGGDFTRPARRDSNCVITRNGGRTWTFPAVAPGGYRSCVEYLGQSDWITCGLNGVDESVDDGNTWKRISGEGFHVCRKAKNGSAVFLAGAGGRIALLVK